MSTSAGLSLGTIPDRVAPISSANWASTVVGATRMPSMTPATIDLGGRGENTYRPMAALWTPTATVQTPSPSGEPRAAVLTAISVVPGNGPSRQPVVLLGSQYPRPRPL